MSTKACDICNNTASKYSCPHCAIRYCSIACFKTHIVTHETDAQDNKLPAAIEDVSPASGARDVAFCAPQGCPTSNASQALQQDGRFQQLLTTYPNLKSQLGRIHAATQNPCAQTPEEVEEGRRRPRPQDRVAGQWTQDKADELAASLLMDLREHDEGVGEFMALFPQILGAGSDNPVDGKQTE